MLGLLLRGASRASPASIALRLPRRAATGSPFASAAFCSVRLANASPLAVSRVVRARHHLPLLRQQPFHQVATRGRARAKQPLSGSTVVLGLISANVAVTMLWLTAHSQRKKRRMMAHFTTSVLHLERGQYYTLVTSMFSQADIGHLFANMLGLICFGHQMCDVLGPKRFLALYLGSGVLSSGAAVLEQRYADRMSLNLGASGAVNSITAISVLLFPRSTLLIFGIVPMRAWLAGSLIIGKDAYSWATDRRDGIGHFAHLSGAFCGAAYYFYLRHTGVIRYIR